MNTNNDGWIETAQRMPTEADLPVWAANTGERPVLVGAIILWRWTHWKPADIPAPPPREESQSNKDTKAYVEKYGCACLSMVLKGMTCYTSDIWHAAIAYERAEVGKMLPHLNGFDRYETADAINAIRARCGGVS